MYKHKCLVNPQAHVTQGPTHTNEALSVKKNQKVWPHRLDTKGPGCVIGEYQHLLHSHLHISIRARPSGRPVHCTLGLMVQGTLKNNNKSMKSITELVCLCF